MTSHILHETGQDFSCPARLLQLMANTLSLSSEFRTMELVWSGLFCRRTKSLAAFARLQHTSKVRPQPRLYKMRFQLLSATSRKSDCKQILQLFILIFPMRCNITQLIYLWKTVLHISGVISTHHQHIQLYLQYLVLVNGYCYLPLLWKSWSWSDCGVGIVPIGTNPTPHSDQLQISHNRGRYQ